MDVPRRCGSGPRSTWGRRAFRRPPTSDLRRGRSGEGQMTGTTSNEKLKDWVDEWAGVFQPADVYWCDGSAEEYDRLCQLLVEGGTFEKLSDAKRPNSYLALSDPGDVARVEDRTFICSEQEIDAGPTNNWRPPAEMKAEMLSLYTGA